ncbi:hypothetical protein P3T43_007312, partial [Paraburkholderia sp. GAS41]|uniref:hypothetical protein n=1 Tax=Paraburkholderia sp. GAS41 TaxID=3035134 RepID=UPI003D1E6742
HALSRSVKHSFNIYARYGDYPAPARGQPPDGGSLVDHRLPASFAFGLTRRCAACPNQIKKQDPVLT